MKQEKNMNMALGEYEYAQKRIFNWVFFIKHIYCQISSFVQNLE